MSRSINRYLIEEDIEWEEEHCPGVGSGSRKGLMRKKLGYGLGSRSGKGSKKGKHHAFRKMKEDE